MKSLTKEKRYDLIDSFNSTSRYLDDLLKIDNIYFEHMVHRIYPAGLQLNKANASDTEAAFLDFNLSIYNDIVFKKYMINRMVLILILLIFPSCWRCPWTSLLWCIYISTYSLCQYIFACY